jgi:hypothetical protein
MVKRVRDSLARKLIGIASLTCVMSQHGAVAVTVAQLVGGG